MYEEHDTNDLLEQLAQVEEDLETDSPQAEDLQEQADELRAELEGRGAL